MYMYVIFYVCMLCMCRHVYVVCALISVMIIINICESVFVISRFVFVIIVNIIIVTINFIIAIIILYQFFFSIVSPFSMPFEYLLPLLFFFW